MEVTAIICTGMVCAAYIIGKFIDCYRVTATVRGFARGVSDALRKAQDGEA